MKLVINIPESDYRYIKELQYLIIARGTCKTIQREVINAIKKGTPYEDRPKGKWEVIGFADSYAYCKCSECGKTTRLYRDSKNEFCCLADIREKAVACLYCGADMKGEEE